MSWSEKNTHDVCIIQGDTFYKGLVQRFELNFTCGFSREEELTRKFALHYTC